MVEDQSGHYPFLTGASYTPRQGDHYVDHYNDPRHSYHDHDGDEHDDEADDDNNNG